MTNEAGQGIQGLGVADPNYLATVHENTQAHMAEDAARQYEGDIAKGVGAANSLGLNLANLDEDTKRAILASQTDIYGGWQSGQFGMARDANNKPQWWQSFLSGVIPAI